METTETTSPSADGFGISDCFISLDSIEASGPDATITERWYRLHTHAKSMCELMVAFNASLEPGYAPQGLGSAVHAQLARLENLVAAARISITPAVAATDDWKRDGSKCPSDSFAGKTGTSRGKARADMETGKNLANAPGTQESFLNGDLSPEQAATIADAVKANPAAEQALLDCAKRKSLKELKTEALRRKSEVEDMDERERRLHRQRYVRQWTDSEGAWNLRARGPVPTGADFQSVLERLIDQQFKAARKSGQRGTRDNYAYDALMDLAAQHGMGSGPATPGAPGPSTDPASERASGTAPEPSRSAPKSQRPSQTGRRDGGADDHGREDRHEDGHGHEGRSGDGPGGIRPRPGPTRGPASGSAAGSERPKPAPTSAPEDGGKAAGERQKPTDGRERAGEADGVRPKPAPTSAPEDGGKAAGERQKPKAPSEGAPAASSKSSGDPPTGKESSGSTWNPASGESAEPSNKPRTTDLPPAQRGDGDGQGSLFGPTGLIPDETGRPDRDGGPADAHGPAAQTGPTETRSGPAKRRSRPPVSQQQVYCIDWNALVRGHARTGERCELRGVGPTSVSTIRRALGLAAAKLVVTDPAGRAVTVAHLGTGPINLRLIPGLTRPSSTGVTNLARLEPTASRKLVIIGISVDDLRGNTQADSATIGTATIAIPGVGRLPGRAALSVLGSEVMARLVTRGQAVRELSYAGRAPNAAQRIALAWADLTCKVEGCPNERIEIDHRNPWAADRVTELDNLDPLCGHHHDLKTNAGWQFVASDSTRFVPPDDPDHPLGIRARERNRNAS